MATGTGPCAYPQIANDGPREWSLSRDRDGYRDYTITYRVLVDPADQGPYSALTLTPGLPTPGSTWTETDAPDPWAFCTQEVDVVQVGKGPDNVAFDLTFHYSTRPTIQCAEDPLTNPVLLPDRIKVETVNYVEEKVFDRNGIALTNSAWEQYRGPQVEYDAHRLRVIIEQNVPDLELDVVDGLMHKVNDATLWGFPARSVKLSQAEMEPKYHSNCDKYWLRRLVFDVGDFDRCLLDEGTRVLRGAWDHDPNSETYGQYVLAPANPLNPFSTVPDPDNPADFIRYKDWNGENTRVILNGRGKPYDANARSTATDDDVQGENCYEVYEEGNMNLLTVPTDLDP